MRNGAKDKSPRVHFTGIFDCAQLGTVDFSSEITMPIDSTAECAEERGGLKTILKLCALAFSAVVNHLIFRQSHVKCSLRGGVVGTSGGWREGVQRSGRSCY